MSELNSSLRHGFSLWQQNPVLVHGLGLSPLLALSTSVTVTIGLLICLGLLLITGSIAQPFIKRHISEIWRLASLVLLLALLTTLIGIALAHFFPALHQALGLYLPLLCCNFAVIVQLSSADHDQGKQVNIGPSLTMIAGYALAMLSFASLRELLIRGSLLSDSQLLIPGTETGTLSQLTPEQYNFFTTPPAALLLLGLLLAACNFLRSRSAVRGDQNKQTIVAAPRARVTEKLQ